MDLLLGLDVGTTATKALLMNVEGEVIASASYGYGLITPREDWVEQDPEDEPAELLLRRIRAEREAAGAGMARGRARAAQRASTQRPARKVRVTRKAKR